MRVFITGGTGFLGSFAIDAFVNDGHDVCILLRPDSDTWRIQKRLLAVTIIFGSLDEPHVFADDLYAFCPDTVLNIAWTGVSNQTHNDTAQCKNLDRVRELFKVCAHAGATNWIGIGSQAEYGLCEKAITEKETPHPTTTYGTAKLQAMRLTQDLCLQNSLRFVWMRLFACYGPRDKESWLIPFVIQALFNGQEPDLTVGRQRCDYLYVTDAAAALLTVANSQNVSGVYNLGSGTAVTVRSVAEMIRDLIDPLRPLGFGRRLPPQKPLMSLSADITKLITTTGWTPTTPIQEGLEETISWFRRNNHTRGK